MAGARRLGTGAFDRPYVVGETPQPTRDCVPSVTRVLVVDDDELDARMIKRDLERANARVQVDVASTFEAGLAAACSGHYCAGIVDYRLGARTGVDLIERSRSAGSQIPLILLTGQGGLDVDVEAMQRGATDYLSKDEMTPTSLERSIRYALDRQTGARELLKSQRRYEAAVLGSHDGIWDWDLRTGELYLSPRFKSMTGIDDSTGVPPREAWLARVHDEDREQLESAIDAHLEGATEGIAVEYRVRTGDGSWLWVYLRGLALRDAAGKVERLAGSQTDISHRKIAEEKARHESLHDPLTGIANRLLLFDRLRQAIHRVEREQGYGFSVLYIDLDGFKRINDRLGHAAGDAVLVEVAARIQSALRAVDSVARVGGDEFVVLLDRCQTLTDADAVANKIEAAVQAPIDCLGRRVAVGASTGIRVVDDTGVTEADILADADRAMYLEKNQRRCIALIPPRRNSEDDEASLGSDLRRALRRLAIEPHYQPIVDTATGGVVGYEALARWNDEQRGPVSPAQFVPIARRSGLIVQLGRTMLAQACDWAARGPGGSFVSVNISPEHVSFPRFREHVEEALALTGLDPQRLRLEITEHAQLVDDNRTRSTLQALAEQGVNLDIDDFGTGFSCIGLLLRIPVSAIKIDRSLIASVHTDPRKKAVVRHLVALAHSIGITATAEGVETREEWDAARATRIDRVQGFFFGRPSVSPRLAV